MARNDEDPQVASPAAAPTANPGPLGLCGFALTTFVLSAANAKLFPGPEVVIGLAMFYGGLAQLLAGMWEFKIGNTFGATAFTSYGAFWLAFAATIELKLVEPGYGLAFFLLGWTIFTAMLFVASFRVSTAIMVLFALLLITFVLLTLGAFGFPSAQLAGDCGIAGGYMGIATAIAAWYAALAGLLASVKSPIVLPVGTRA
jgi:uncharacterized protein